ncbi:MAG: CoA pyrophosphatase [Chloroflexota bacterium]|nr:CoA pyrophosphatase [Chloroflexota bacterium]
MSLEETLNFTPPPDQAERRPAAVLLLVRQIEGAPHLLFMRRTEKVHTHKGQISFPGGGFKPGDGTLANTALRETEEEVGLAANRVRVLGHLPPTDTVVSNFLVYPFVGVLNNPNEPLEFVPDDFEVAELLQLPLLALLDPKNIREEMWVLRGKAQTVNFYNYKNLVIWGATAHILDNFLHEIRAGKWATLFE